MKMGDGVRRVVWRSMRFAGLETRPAANGELLSQSPSLWPLGLGEALGAAPAGSRLYDRRVCLTPERGYCVDVRGKRNG